MGKLYNSYISSYKMDTPQWREFLEIAGDIYYRPELQGLEKFEQHFKINRLQHIRSVSYLSFLASKKLKLNVKETCRGALMHDLFYYDWREKDKSHRLHGYRHPGFALKNAYELVGTLTPIEKNIIQRHMWPLTPTPPKYREAFVVSFMDKYCATIELVYSFSESYRNKFHEITGIGGETCN